MSNTKRNIEGYLKMLGPLGFELGDLKMTFGYAEDLNRLAAERFASETGTDYRHAVHLTSMEGIEMDNINQLNEKIGESVSKIRSYREEIRKLKKLRIELVAKLLHEAGRVAVENGATVAAADLGVKSRKFLEWDEISEQARDGRRMQAEYILGLCDISMKSRYDGQQKSH